MSEVFCNGSWVARDDARVSAFDAGMTHGVGLFETMSGRIDGAQGPQIARLGDHLARLERSARELGLVDNLRTTPLGDAALEAVAKAGRAGEHVRVRLTITGGDLNLLQTSGQSQHTPTVLINATPATAYPEAMFERGIGLTIADSKANPLDPTASHKTLNYWWRLRELQQAARKGAGEALVLQVTNHVCGVCVGNLFVVSGGVLRTPIARGEETEGGIPSPVMPGVTRAAVIEAASAMGIGCERAMLGVGDVLDADEVFITNSSWGVLPMVKLEAEAIGDAVPGEITKRVRAALLADDSAWARTV
ncbi:MAG: aminotransferase class IV [Planctomycetota bacterium]